MTKLKPESEWFAEVDPDLDELAAHADHSVQGSGTQGTYGGAALRIQDEHGDKTPWPRKKPAYVLSTMARMLIDGVVAPVFGTAYASVHSAYTSVSRMAARTKYVVDTRMHDVRSRGADAHDLALQIFHGLRGLPGEYNSTVQKIVDGAKDHVQILAQDPSGYAKRFGFPASLVVAQSATAALGGGVDSSSDSSDLERSIEDVPVTFVVDEPPLVQYSFEPEAPQ